MVKKIDVFGRNTFLFAKLNVYKEILKYFNEEMNIMMFDMGRCYWGKKEQSQVS